MAKAHPLKFIAFILGLLVLFVLSSTDMFATRATGQGQSGAVEYIYIDTSTTAPADGKIEAAVTLTDQQGKPVTGRTYGVKQGQFTIPTNGLVSTDGSSCFFSVDPALVKEVKDGAGQGTGVYIVPVAVEDWVAGPAAPVYTLKVEYKGGGADTGDDASGEAYKLTATTTVNAAVAPASDILKFTPAQINKLSLTVPEWQQGQPEVPAAVKTVVFRIKLIGQARDAVTGSRMFKGRASTPEELSNWLAPTAYDSAGRTIKADYGRIVEEQVPYFGYRRGEWRGTGVYQVEVKLTCPSDLAGKKGVITIGRTESGVSMYSAATVNFQSSGVEEAAEPNPYFANPYLYNPPKSPVVTEIGFAGVMSGGATVEFPAGTTQYPTNGDYIIDESGDRIAVTALKLRATIEDPDGYNVSDAEYFKQASRPDVSQDGTGTHMLPEPPDVYSDVHPPDPIPGDSSVIIVYFNIPSADVKTYPQAQYDFWVHGKSASGTWGSAPVNYGGTLLSTDFTKPTAVVTKPVTDEYVRGPYRIEGDASKGTETYESDLNVVQVYEEGTGDFTDLAENDSGRGGSGFSKWYYIWDSTAADDGKYVFRSRAVDLAGNYGDESRVSMIVDNVKTITNVTIPLEGYGWDNSGAYPMDWGLTGVVYDPNIPPQGTLVKGGSTDSNATDRANIGGSWSGSTLSADRMLAGDVTLLGVLNMAPNSILAWGSTVKAGTTAANAADRLAIGGVWSGTTLTADVTIINNTTIHGIVALNIGSILKLPATILGANSFNKYTFEWGTGRKGAGDTTGWNIPIGGTWSGGGPYTLDADRTLVLDAVQGTYTAAAGTTFKAGTFFKGGTVCETAHDRDAIGGGWFGTGPYTLNVDWTTTTDATTDDVVTATPGSIYKIGSTFTTGTTCTDINDTLGSWAFSSGHAGGANQISTAAAMGAWNTAGLATGDYSLRVTGIDRAGNVNLDRPAADQINRFYIHIDTVAPSVSITPAIGGWWQQIVSGTAADDISGVNKVEILLERTDTSQYWNGTAWVGSIPASWPTATIDTGAGLPSATWHYDGPDNTNLPRGTTVIVHARATDDVKNIPATIGHVSAEATETGLWDPDKPVTSVPGSANGTNGWYMAPAPSFTISASDTSPGSGMNGGAVWYVWTTQSVGTAPASGWTQLSYTTSPLSIKAPTGSPDANGIYALSTGSTMPDGKYRLWYRGRDVSGNVEVNHYSDFKIDATPPPTPGIYAENAQWYGSDIGESAYTEGTANTEYGPVVTDANLDTGTCTYWFQRATDSGFTAGLADSGSWQTQTTYIGYPAYATSFYYQFTGLVDAQIYYYRVKAKDYAGNESVYSGSQSSTQDNLPAVLHQNNGDAGQTQPTVMPGTWQNTNKTVEIWATDTSVGPKGFRWAWDGSPGDDYYTMSIGGATHGTTTFPGVGKRTLHVIGYDNIYSYTSGSNFSYDHLNNYDPKHHTAETDYEFWYDPYPPYNWQGFSYPALYDGWSQTLSPTGTVTIQDDIAVPSAVSGLKVTEAKFAYSSDGGSSWSSWLTAGATGADGSINVETLTASGFSFTGDSATLNKIKYRIPDVAGSLVDSPAYTVKVDSTPPSVLSTVPANDPDPDTPAPLVAPETPLRATFDDDMLASTVNDVSNFTLEMADPGTSDWTPVSLLSSAYTAGTKTVNIVPTATLAPTHKYRLTVLTNVKDKAGNAIAAPYVWSWYVSNVTASIDWPYAGNSVYGTIPVHGKAAGSDAKFYKLQYGSGASPGAWTDITGALATSVNSLSHSQTDWSGSAVDPAETTILPNGYKNYWQQTGVDTTSDAGAIRLAKTTAAGSWYNKNWIARKRIVVSNPNAAALYNYQVKLTVDWTSDMRTDFGDLRFTDYDKTSSLDYWMESYTAGVRATVWVEVPNVAPAGNKTVYMYYGNPAATTASNVSNTFLNNQVFLRTFVCNATIAAAPYYGIQNHANFDSYMALMGDTGYAIYGTGYVNLIYHTTNPYGSSDNYTSQYKFLFVPAVSGTYKFGTNSDAASEALLNIADADSAHNALVGWYGNHGVGTQFDDHSGSYALTANAPVWLEYRQNNSDNVSRQAQMGIMVPGQAWKQVDTTNFSGQLFARNYATVEPTAAIYEDAVYESTGSLTSSIIDGGASVTWGAVAWTENIATGTDVTVQLRTSADAATWTDWSYPRSVATGDAIPSGIATGRYIQYKINLKGNAAATKTPSVADITLYNTALGNWDTKTVADGTYTIRLLTTIADPADWSADNVLEARVTVSVDNTSKPTSTVDYFAPPVTETLTFTSSGTFTPPTGTTSVSVMVVGGGGGGGSDMGGGGGGGGVVYNPAYSFTPSVPVTVTVGNGGNGAPAGVGQVRGTSGQNSVFGTITATGGGGGASNHDRSTAPAGNGGSGGGASGGAQPPNGGSGGAGGYGGSARGTGTVGQGYDGSWGIYAWYPGGGGGAGGAGSTNPATGGPGIRNSGISPYYFGGGGGGSGYSGNGGNGGIGGGGGGAVGTTTGGAGINDGSPGGGGSTNSQTNRPGGNAGANTGGGGGGGSHYSSNNYGGSGGSGIVIVKYTYIPTNYVKTNDDITGTATDLFPGIGAVDIRLKRVSDNHYWDGTDWDSTDSNTWVTTDSTGSHNATWAYNADGSKTIFATGDYTIESRATDKAGAVENTPYSLLAITCDATPPDVALDFPNTPNNYVSADYVGINGKATDANLLNYKVEYQKDGSAVWNQIGSSRTSPAGGFAQTTTLDFKPNPAQSDLAAGFDGTRAIDGKVMLGRRGSTAQYPNQASLETSVTASGFNSSGAGVVGTDGSYLYVKRYGTWAGPASFNKIGTGYNGTGAGTNYGQLNAGIYSDSISAFYLDGYMYNGYTNDGNTLERQNVTTGAIEYVQMGGNTIPLPRGVPGSVDYGGAGLQTVIKDGSTYKMWYSGSDGGNWRVYYAESTDGLSWTKYATPAVDLGGLGSWDDNAIYYPTVVKDGSTYKMWYTGHDHTNTRLGYATSTDGLTWTKYAGNPVVPLGTGSDFDNTHAQAPTVLIESPTDYKMWYSGSNGSNWRIGYATSSDGITWTKYTAGNPVMQLGTGWESSHNFAPVVIKDGSTYKMWYAGSNGNWRIGYATSTNGTTWTNRQQVMDLGATGTFNSSHTHKPAVVKDGSTYRMWYTGHDGIRWAGVSYATSSDGLTWTKNPAAPIVGDRLLRRSNAADLTKDNTAAERADLMVTTDGRYIYTIGANGTTNWKVRIFDSQSGFAKVGDFTTVMDGFTAYDTWGFIADGFYIYPIEAYYYYVGNPYYWGNMTIPGDNSRVTRIGTGLNGTTSGEIVNQWYEGAFDEFEVNGQYDPLNRKVWMGKIQGGTNIYRFNAGDESATSGTYTSRLFDMGPSPTVGTISWTASTPGGTTLAVQTRVSSARTFSTEDTTVTSNWATVTSGGAIPTGSVANPRYVQYKVTMTGPGGATSPYLDDITLRYTPSNSMLETWRVVDMTEGKYKVRLTGTDKAGNVVSATADPVYIDKTQPTASLDALLNLDANNTGYVSGTSVALGGTADATRSWAPDDNIASWTIEHKRTGASVWTPVATNSTKVPPASFGAWDTTVAVPEGTEDNTAYSVRLRVTGKSGLTTYAASQSVFIDNSAPAISSTIPASGATNVDSYQNLTAYFDDLMYSPSIGAGSFLLNGGAVTPSSVIYADQLLSSYATFVLANPLTMDTAYTASLTTDIHNKAGRAIPATAWSFTTSKVDAALYLPMANTHVAGTYPVMGRANGSVFGEYRLEWASGRQDSDGPGPWTVIGTQSSAALSQSNVQTTWNNAVNPNTSPVSFGTTSDQYYVKDANVITSNAGYVQLGSSNIKWLSGAWSARKPVTVNNTGQATALTNYQVQVTVPFTTGMKTDFSDLRFTDADGQTLLSYWIEKYTASTTATVWVKVPSIAASSNKTIYMYYGNAGAPNGQSPATTFDFFDGFDTGSTINATRWDTSAALGFLQAGGRGQLKATTTGGRLTSNTTFSYPTILEAREMSAYIPANGIAVLGFYGSASNDFGIRQGPGATYYRNDTTEIGLGNLMLEDTWYRLTVEPRTQFRTRYKIVTDATGVVQRDETITNAVSGERIALGRRYDDNYSEPTSTSWDWVLARKYTVVEPSASLGSADSYHNIGQMTSVVFDGSTAQNWQLISWTENVPKGANITFETRTGDVATPDGTWTSWSAASSYSGGTVIPAIQQGKRYIQYRVSFYGNGATLLDVTIWHTPLMNWDTTELSDGPYTLRLSVTDTAGDWTDSHVLSKAVPVNVDNTAPSVAIVNPADGSLITNMQTVAGIAGDSGATVRKVEIQADQGTLVGEWHFDEGGGSVVTDSSGNGNNGVLYGTGYWSASGKYGAAFNGSGDDYALIPDSPSLRTSKYTVEVWIKPEIPSTLWQGIVGKPGRNNNIWLNSAGYIHHRFHIADNTNAGAPNTPNSSIAWTTWNHVVITNDGALAKTYINGVEMASGLAGGPLIVDNQPLVIGRSLDNGDSGYFTGLIDEVKIYNMALSPDQVVARYANESISKPWTIAVGSSRVNEDVSAAVYSGDWTTYTGPEPSDGTLRETVVPGSSVTYTFTGTAINLIAKRGPWQGYASVQVDSETPVLVDLYSPIAVFQQTVFSQTGLASPGTHTVTVTNTGTSNPAASGIYINIDAFETGGTINWTYDWVTNSALDGNSTFSARATDVAGNFSGQASRTVTIDNTNPNSVITNPLANSAFTSDQPVNGTASDTNFDHYDVDFSYGAAAEDWIPLATGTSPITAGNLGTWTAPTRTPLYDWQTDGDAENWGPQQGITNISVSGGSYNGTTAGTAPYYIQTPPKLAINGNETKVLKIRMKVSDASGYAKLFWKYTFPYYASYMTVSGVNLPLGEQRSQTNELEWGEPRVGGVATFGTESRRMIKWPVINPGEWVEYTVDMSLGKVWVEGDSEHGKNTPLMDYSQIWPTTGFWAGTVYQLRFDPSDVAGVNFNIDHLSLGSADGNYKIRLTTTDRVGRTSETNQYPVMIDRNTPACIINTPINMTFLGSGTGVAVTGTATDDLVNAVASGVEGVDYRVIQNVDSFAPTVGPWLPVTSFYSATMAAGSTLRTGSTIRAGTVCSDANDRIAIGGVWSGSTLSTNRTLAGDRTLAGTLTLKSAPVFKANTVFAVNSTCTSPYIRDCIGGTWSGPSGGTYTLTGARTLPMDAAIILAWSTTANLPAGWHGLQARAYDRAGNTQESNYSYVTVDTDAPPVPRIRSMADRSRGGILLSWTPVKDPGSGTDYYVLYRGNTPVTTGMQYPDGVAIEAADAELITRDFGNGNETFRAFHACNAIDTAFTPNTNIRYYIRAVDQVGNYSAKGSISGLYDTQPPSTPSNLTATRAGTTTSTQLAWNPSTDNQQIAEYRVYRIIKPSVPPYDFTPSESNKIGVATVTGTFFTTKFFDSNLAENTSYLYKVVAYDDSLLPSDASNVAEVAIGTKQVYNSILPHKTFSANSDQCVMCHRTHTGPGKNLLKRTYEADTCYTCHDGTGSNTPTKAEFDYAPNGLHRVKDDLWPSGALSCIDCHNPHLNTELASYENFDDVPPKTVTDGTPVDWIYRAGDWATTGNTTHIELSQTNKTVSSLATSDTGINIAANGGYFSTMIRFDEDGGQAYYSLASNGLSAGNGVTLILDSVTNEYQLMLNGSIVTERTQAVTITPGTVYRIKVKLDEDKTLNAKLYTVAKSDLPTGHDVITDTIVGSIKHTLVTGDYKGSFFSLGTFDAKASFDQVRVNTPGMLQNRYRRFYKSGSAAEYTVPDDRVMTEAFCLSCHGSSSDDPGGSHTQYYSSIHNPLMGGMVDQSLDQDNTGQVKSNPAAITPRWQEIRAAWYDIKTNTTYKLTDGRTIGELLKGTANGCLYCHGYHGQQWYDKNATGEEELCYMCHGRTANYSRDGWNVYRQYSGYIEDTSARIDYSGTWSEIVDPKYGGGSTHRFVSARTDWYNTDWSKRQPVTITNTGAALTNYQVKLNVGYDSAMKSDFSDLRFTKADGTTLLDYWVESVTTSNRAIVWVEIPSIPTGGTKLYMYFNNPGAASASNGVNTFDFFDDFNDGSLDTTNRWIEKDTAANFITESDGYLKVSGGNGSWRYVALYSKNNYNRPFIFETSQKYTSGQYNMIGVKNNLDSAQNTVDYYVQFPYAAYNIFDGGGNRLAVYEDGNNRGDQLHALSATDWNYEKFTVKATGAIYYHGDLPQNYTQYYNSTYSTNNPDKVGFANNNQAFWLDNARIRKYAAAEPGAAFGATELPAGARYGFDSTYVNVYCETGPGMGTIRIFVDSVEQTPVNLGALPTGTNTLVFEKTGLASGTRHTIDIMPVVSSGTVDIDAVKGSGSKHGLTMLEATIKCTSCHGQRAMTDRHVYEGYPTSVITNPNNIKQYWSDQRMQGKTINDYCNACHKEADRKGRVLIETHTSSKIVPYTIRYPAMVTTPSANGFDRTGYTLGDSYTAQENFPGVIVNNLADWTSVTDDLYDGGAARYSETAGAWLEYNFQGSSITFVTRKSALYGYARITIDGVPINDGEIAVLDDAGGNKSGFDLYNPTDLWTQAIYTKSGLDPSIYHTIRIYVVGAGRFIGNNRVDVDAFRFTVPRVGHYLYLAPWDPIKGKRNCASTCHDDLAPYIRDSQEASTKITCTTCHHPHASDNARLVYQPEDFTEANGTVHKGACLHCHDGSVTK